MALPPRNEVPVEETWNAESVYDSPQAWDAERESLAAALEGTATYPGTLGQGAAQLAAWLALKNELGRRIEKLAFYAFMSQAVDTADQAAAAMVGQVESLYSRFLAACSFAGPEILAIGEEHVGAMVAGEPALQAWAHWLDNLFRKAAHVRSTEVEEVLALTSEPSPPSTRPARCCPAPTCVSPPPETARARRSRWPRARCRPSSARATARRGAAPGKATPTATCR